MDKVIKHEKLCFDDLKESFEDLIESMNKVKGRKNKNKLVSRLIDINENIEHLKKQIDNLLLEINTCYDITPSEKEEKRIEENKRFKKMWSMLGPAITVASLLTTAPIEEENNQENDENIENVEEMINFF